MKTLLKYLSSYNIPEETKIQVYKSYYKSSEHISFRTEQARRDYCTFATEDYCEKYTHKITEIKFKGNAFGHPFGDEQ